MLMALHALQSIKSARFDLSRSGVTSTSGTSPLARGLGRVSVHVAPHRAHYRMPAVVSRGRSSRGRPQPTQPRVAAGPMIDSSSDEVLSRLNRAYKRRPMLTAFFGVLFAIALVEGYAIGSTQGATLVFGMAAGLVLWFVRARENVHHSEAVEYVLDAQAAQAYRRLLKAFRRLSTSGPVWRIDARRTADGRRVSRRRAVRPTLALPPRVISNIRVPKVRCGSHTLYFFPDRLLIYDAQIVWGVFYHELQVKAGDVRQVAEAAEPDNTLHGFLALGTASGVNLILRWTDPSGAVELGAALEALA
jgi:hypothetical protein